MLIIYYFKGDAKTMKILKYIHSFFRENDRIFAHIYEDFSLMIVYKKCNLSEILDE
jgi:hypothetical protein